MDLLQRFENFYSDFKGADLSRLGDLYSADLSFRDPVQEVLGLAALKRYFAASQQGVAECRFEFLDRVNDDTRCFYQWRMHYRHPRLEGGRFLCLRGMSRLQLSSAARSGGACIETHEDIYDMGAMLYEHVPVLRTGVRWLKGRLQEGSGR